MQGRRSEDEHSMFETSHVLGSYLASTPLLAQAWRQCSAANTGTSSFATELIDGVLYVAFSGANTITVTAAAGQTTGFFCTVPIGSGGGHELFSPLVRGGEDGCEPVLVHARSLYMFLAIYNTPEFQMLITEASNKAVIFTGHSIGGSLASLAALYFLCSSSSSNSPSPSNLLCITFGSPLLGNESLSRAVLRERWGGKFCHLVTQHDVLPRLLFCPMNSLSPQLIAHLLQSWQFSIQYPQLTRSSPKLFDQSELCEFISMHVRRCSSDNRSLYWPFGCYAMCSDEGAVCIDNPLAVVQMLYLTFAARAMTSSLEEEHLSYGELVVKISQNLLMKRKSDIGEEALGSNYSAAISLAVLASGIEAQDMGAMEARECLQMSRRMGQSPNLNCSNLIIRLAKVTPYRAQIEWYKALCDDGTGYYDSFKHRKASKRESKVNMNRIKLAQFWDAVVDMLQSNQLPCDFHKRAKWVNAAHFYKLLVEPLDIAEYYRTQMHMTKGHYLTHGRARRYEVFDRWWIDRHKGDVEGGGRKRSKFAGLTQDSCFWARVEEAREGLECAKSERDISKLSRILSTLNKFESEARQLVEAKEVSRDAVAPRSSYSLWMEEWKDLKWKLGMQIPLHNSMTQSTLALG